MWINFFSYKDEKQVMWQLFKVKDGLKSEVATNAGTCVLQPKRNENNNNQTKNQNDSVIGTPNKNLAILTLT